MTTAETVIEGRPETRPTSLWRDTAASILRQRSAIFGLVILSALVLVAIFAPVIATHDPNQALLGVEQGVERRAGPCIHALGCPEDKPQHLFGTDGNFRDVFSRVVYGARVTLPLSLVVVALAATVGAIIGAVAGYFRGPLDGLCMRGTDLVFAFPPIILAMVVAAVLGRGLQNAAIAIVIVAWPPYARIVRGLVMSVGDTEYVQSARLLGASARRALVRDVLPNVIGPVFVLMTLDLATAILLLSGLSFLGLGAQPPQAEWGSMVADGTQYFQWWWMGTFPGLAIFTVVLAFNFLGDSLRDVFDPRSGLRDSDEP